MLLLGDILRRRAAVCGDKTAYVVGTQRITYRAFHARSNQLGRALQRLGVRRGDRVAVMANNRAEYPVIYFATIKLGAIVVPVNARFTGSEVATIVTHAEAETFFVAGEFAALVGELREAEQLPSVRRFIFIDAVEPKLPLSPSSGESHDRSGGTSVPPFEKGGPGGIFDRSSVQIPLNPPFSKGEAAGQLRKSTLSARRGENDDLQFDRLADAESADDIETAIDEQDAHVMLYTSGTTGSPKGTLLSQRSYYLQGMTSHLQLGFNEDDIGLSMFPMFHMGGWALPLGFWHTGGTAVIMPKAEPRAILETIERERVTYFYAVPTVFRSLLAIPDFDRFDLSSLRLLGGGTAAMSRAQVQEIMDRFCCRSMVILYGSTEAGPVSVVRPGDVPRKPETVGRPYLDVEVRLVDETGHDVASGGVGEIAVRSEFTMKGYWRNPEETARVFRDGWVLTGDLGVFDAEGFLSIVGRRKEVIRSGGESIFPVEIERALLTHAEIREASVVGVPDPHWGEAVVAAVVLRDGAALSAEDVIEYVRARLASYKKPRHVCFLPALPRTAASQQVHKPLLKERILELLSGAQRGSG